MKKFPFRNASAVAALTLILSLLTSHVSAGARPTNGTGPGGPAEHTPYTTETKLLVGDGGLGDYYGYSVACERDTIVVGAPNASGLGYLSGSAYVFAREGSGWSLRQKLNASDAAPYGFFGTSVAVSGDTIVVGAYGDQNAGIYSGAAYVFVRDGESWTQRQKLVGSESSTADSFGLSVDVEGDTAVVGAFGDSGAGYAGGSAYVFKRDAGGVWTQRQKLNAGDATADSNFGISVGLSGGSIVVGAYGDSASGFYSGAAYVFVERPAGWAEQQKLTARDSAESLQLGYRVAVSGDTVVACAPGDARGKHTMGGAYVFERKGGAWKERKKLSARNARNFGGFATSIAIDGDTIAVGNSDDDEADYWAGSVYVYKRKGGAGWVEQRKLLSTDITHDDSFGIAVAVGDGLLTVGAFGKDLSAIDSGAAYAYQ
jgi:hypothetical protein